MRRCLRNEFTDARYAAQLLGRLMIQGRERSPPVLLLGFFEAGESVSHEVAHLIRIMERSSRAMLAR